MKLGVNIDHVATLRQQRRGREPDPVAAALAAESAGADSIVCHLREDRRHIQERDLVLLRQLIKTRLNLEMAVSEEIIAIALREKPDWVTLVPERRAELTTEGGLACAEQRTLLRTVVGRFQSEGIPVSLFIDADPVQIKAAAEVGAGTVELHTGRYADAVIEAERLVELKRIQAGVKLAGDLGLKIAAGHGLDYRNVRDIAAIPAIEELNIGYAIIGRAVFTGLEKAVKEMLGLIGEVPMLINQQVRLVLWRTSGNEGVAVVVRGMVVEETETLLKVDGRLYQQMMDEKSGDTIERPIGNENRAFIIPVSTIRYGEVITEDSPAQEIDRKARLQKPLSRGEIRKIGGLT